MMKKFLCKGYHNLLRILLVCMLTGCIPENIELPTAEAVDLGLSVKWASCNVGSVFPEDYGDYFAWGETEEKSSYTELNSVTYDLSYSELKSRGIIGYRGYLTTAHEVVTANWGCSWRMPTWGEMKELIDYCTWSWTTQNDVEGYKVTGPNGNSIFLPAAGIRNGTEVRYRGSYGYYWSGTPDDENSRIAYFLNFADYFVGGYDHSEYRYYGLTVRPVYVGVSATTGNATDITDYSATLSGTVNNAYKSVTCGIIYGTSSTLSSTSGTKKSTTSSSEFSVNVTGLSPNTTYYYRAYVVADDGEYNYGEVFLFTTGPITIGDAIDLGLSVKWASCNVGAGSPEDYGDYFAWGETTTKSSFTKGNSITHGLSVSELESLGIIGTDGNLTAAYDAATTNWGSPWRMPTLGEVKELINNCTWSWITMNGVNGSLVTGPNGNSIFLPAAGRRRGTEVSSRGSLGLYWSGTLSEGYSDSDFAYGLRFISGYHDCGGWDRYYGHTVRPVTAK